jgi:hypothetical protein
MFLYQFNYLCGQVLKLCHGLTIDPTLASFHVFKVRLVSGRACLILRACRSVAFLNHDQGLLNLNIKRIQDLIEAGHQTACLRIPIVEYLL